MSTFEDRIKKLSAAGGTVCPVRLEDDEGGDEVMFPGMSLRDWFAGQALMQTHSEHRFDYGAIADECYRMADAMIKARSK